MLWGQRLVVYTDHKNLVRDALGLSSDRVYRWHLILEEYGPEIVYIKGSDNVVADAISRLEYDPKINVKNLHYTQWCRAIAKLLRSCTEDRHGGACKNANSHSMTGPGISLDIPAKDIVNNVFANITDKEDDIYPPTIAEIARAQRKSRVYKHYFRSVRGKKRDKHIKLKVIDDTDILVYKDKRLVIASEKI